MRLLANIILALALVHGINGSVRNSNVRISNNETQLAEDLIEFLRPHAPTIRKWFWKLSGVGAGAQDDRPQSKADYIDCEVCTLGLPLVRKAIAANIPESLIEGALTIACITLELAPLPEICLPTIRSYSRSVIYIIMNKPDLPDDDFCGIINPGCVEISHSLTNWHIQLDDAKPLLKPKPPIPSDSPTTKVLQFTDIHLDMDYKVGMNASCGLPICCREGNGIPENDKHAAGLYGHVSCALPVEGLTALYSHAKENHPDTKFIFLSGDYVHSGVWLYSPAENSRHINEVVNRLAETFPDVPVYPLVGNHEPQVINLYAPIEVWNDFDLSWMYNAVAAPFTKWFLEPNQLNLFKKYGYYTVVPNEYNNMRIIALNTNICYIQNFWLPYDPIDTNGQLKWLANTLQIAEKLKQKVLIVGHIQPGSGSCWPVWSNQFNRIINRYEGIIHGQWYGHSHEQYYKMHLEDGTDRPTSVSFVAGSGLTDGMNSAYNVFYLDGERGQDSTWDVINQESWILKLKESNAAETPIFEKILDAKKDFNMTSLTPEAMYNFMKRMICDEDLFLKYQTVMVKGEDSPRFKGPCMNINCKAKILGDMLQSNSADYSKTNNFIDVIKSTNCDPNLPSNGANFISLNLSLSLPFIMFTYVLLLLKF